MSTAKLYRTARQISAVILIVVAGRHAMQALSGTEPTIRHWVFVLVNISLGALLVWRHRWAFWPALALTAQQMWSHGLELARSFNGTAPLDGSSLAVCLFFPTLVTILFIERSDEAPVAGDGRDARDDV